MLCCVFVFAGCFEVESKKELELKESNKTLEINATKESLEDLEAPLQKELKKNLKSHLDSLSQELHSQNLGDLNFENTGAKEHFKQFESLNQGDLKKDSNKDSPSLHLQKAYILQETQIQKLRQKNDEIGK